ncbi:unnamed protein product [Effrenium voratum]|uniref:Uncharacterized protein n=1 Tax=Effrenium voratum TaxID=2562239 RepID=A0AA36HR03_9DINO|nr:unnamed protein product [Effrenium voratum]CAJ1372678.1 unnamed protein product [Effrenium voratum]
MSEDGGDFLPVGAETQPYARHKALLSGVLGGCAFSAWSFQRGRRQGLGPRAIGAGVACSLLSYSASAWQALQARRHAQALQRLQASSDTIRMVPIGSEAPELPTQEFDEATGQDALQANAELFRRLKKEDSLRRRS